MAAPALTPSILQPDYQAHIVRSTLQDLSRLGPLSLDDEEEINNPPGTPCRNFRQNDPSSCQLQATPRSHFCKVV